MALGLKSNPVASELILPTAFETAQCRLPTINGGRETALRCHLNYVACATGNDIKSKKPGWVQKWWISLRNIDAGFRHFDFAECAALFNHQGFWLRVRPRQELYHVRSITLIPVGAGSPIIFAKNGQSHKRAPAIVLWAIDRTWY